MTDRFFTQQSQQKLIICVRVHTRSATLRAIPVGSEDNGIDGDNGVQEEKNSTCSFSLIEHDRDTDDHDHCTHMGYKPTLLK